MVDLNKMKNIVFQFISHDDAVEIQPLGKGDINDSYKVALAGNEYVLQRINHHSFFNMCPNCSII